MSRWGPRLLAVALVAVMIAPAVGEPSDGFPLSTYPMFAVDRGPISSVSTAVGRTEDDQRLRLSPNLLAGTEEPIMAVRTARVAVARGQADSWCEEVAARVSAAGPGSDRWGDITKIEVVTEVHDSASSLTSESYEPEVREHASCEVERG